MKAFLRKINPKIAAVLGKTAIELLLSTCRVEVEGVENFSGIAEKQRCILMLWHNRLALAAYFLNRYAPKFSYTAFVSNSRDGDFLAAIADSYQQGKAIRVPQHSKHAALHEMIKQLKAQEVMIVTPDGPRGPKYQVKPGIAFAAKNANAQVVPFTWTASSFWQLGTWDSLMLPKPFSKIRVTFGPAVEVKNEQDQILLQHALDQDMHDRTRHDMQDSL